LPTGSYTNPTFSPGTLTNIKNRIFSYVTGTGIFNGNATLLPCATGVFPANCPQDPPLIPINPTPALNIFPPFADEDSALTTTGVPVTIDVLVNDVPMLGILDPASVKIAANPASGIAVVNLPAGTITFTPTDPLVTSASFTYTVANNFGSVSDPGTVTVAMVPPAPIAGNDAAATTTGTPVIISVLDNDTISAPGVINPASLAVTAPVGAVAPNSLSGSAAITPDGTVTYSPPATPGTYTFTYTVQNSVVPSVASNVATVTVTVTAGAAAGVIVVPDQPSPHPFGTPVTLVATRPGGPVNNEYRFWLNSGTGFAIAQDYSPAASWAWTPAAIGNYDIQVDVRTAGSAALREASATISFYQIRNTAPATGVTLVPDVAGPQVAGAPITFTAAGTGSAGPFEYRFWVNSGAGFAIVQDYAPAATLVWTPATTGAYDIMVDVRTVGSTALREASAKIFFYQIQPAPATAVAITSDKASPQAPGTPVIFTAAGSGGAGKYEYRFWLNTGAGFAVAQDYSTLPTWTWVSSAAGNYDVLVDVRSVGSTLFREALNNVFFYQIQ